MLQKEIAGDLQQNIRNEEEEQSDVEVVPSHVEVSLKSLNPSIANVDTGSQLVQLPDAMLAGLPINKTAKLQQK